MPRRSEVDDLLAHADPVRAFDAAHAQGRLIGLRTSGTSGSPRLIVRTTASWTESFEAVSDLAEIDARSRVWVPGPLQATMNLFGRVHAEAMGAMIVDDPAKATHAHLTPAALAQALDHALLEPGVVVIIAGDALPAPTRDRAAKARLGLHHYYGASELSFVSWAVDDGTSHLFPGVECRIVGGVIWVRSPYLSLGYADDADGGALRWDADGFASVGDLGSLVGDVLSVRGRGDEAITTAGATVLVAEIENALRPHATGDLVVVGTPHEVVGEVIVGVVTEPADVAVLMQVARSTLDPRHRPRRWRVIPSLPTTPAGKVDRGRVRGMLADEAGR